MGPGKRFMSTIGSEAIEIKIAHSPDSDDAFMFYGLATNKIRVPGLKFTHVLCDIETLNHKAIDGGLLRRDRNLASTPIHTCRTATR